MGINLDRQNHSWPITEVINNKITDPTAFSTALTNIDKKLSLIKKDITYWDVYKISSAITAPEQFNTKVENLEVNHAAVINTTYFKRQFDGKDTEFYSGDIIIRLQDGSHQHIKAANAGVYIPTITDENGNTTSSSSPAQNLQIKYNYATTVKTEEKEKSGYIQPLSGDESKMYGYTFIVDSDTFSYSFKAIFQQDNKTPIIPVVKFFDENNQEVFTDEYALYQGNTTREDNVTTTDIDESKFNDSNKFYLYLHSNARVIIKKVVIK